MELSAIEKTRKRLLAFWGIACSLIVICGFTIVDFIEGDTVEVIVNILIEAILVAGFIGIKIWNADLRVYRVILALLGVAFLYNVLIGSGNGTAIFWLFSFPLVFLFFLGKKEGLIASAFFFSILYVLLINPFSLNVYSYDVDVSFRFLASLVFVTLIAYGLEISREKYGQLLIDKQKMLLEEKQKLEHAIKEIKTLSGLIPICSNCKKIRDDKGYWQQVEVYVSDHSTADFSHSICPDCVEKFYPARGKHVPKK